jgi:hypothetical protein
MFTQAEKAKQNIDTKLSSPTRQHTRQGMSLVDNRRNASQSSQQPLQAIWIEENEGLLVWHALRDGIRWYLNVEKNTMFYRIEREPAELLSPQVMEFYKKFNGEEMAPAKWDELMSQYFEVKIDELRDGDDPVFLQPDFLKGEEDEEKILLAQKMSMALKKVGLNLFLGGAASGSLLTTTRKVNDLDFRVSGLIRSAFNKDDGPALVKLINDTLTEAGLTLTSAFSAIAVTTIRGEVNDIEVSITSEPDKETTLSRGNLISNLESLGEFDFILDKAAAAATRHKSKFKSVATDLFDIIQVLKVGSVANSGILRYLDAMRGKGTAISLIARLKALLGSKEDKTLFSQMGEARKRLTNELKITPQELNRIFSFMIGELENQEDITVI